MKRFFNQVTSRVGVRFNSQKPLTTMASPTTPVAKRQTLKSFLDEARRHVADPKSGPLTFVMGNNSAGEYLADPSLIQNIGNVQLTFGLKILTRYAQPSSWPTS
jgi:hypothetical protein